MVRLGKRHGKDGEEGVGKDGEEGVVMMGRGRGKDGEEGVVRMGKRAW